MGFIKDTPDTYNNIIFRQKVNKRIYLKKTSMYFFVRRGIIVSMGKKAKKRITKAILRKKEVLLCAMSFKES